MQGALCAALCVSKEEAEGCCVGACRGRPRAADWAGAGHTGAQGPGIQVPTSASFALHATVSTMVFSVASCLGLVQLPAIPDCYLS